MKSFNTAIDYQGQDLHMLRNNKDFPLHLFFSSTANLSYNFRLDHIYTNQDVETQNIKIRVTFSSGRVSSVYIKAEPYPTGQVNRLDNFFVNVKDINTNEEVSILLHIHDSIDKAWVSPGILGLRKGMYAKFGILASFTDGNYADLSFYPEIEKDLINGADYLDITSFPPPPEPPRLTWKATPPENANPISNAIKFVLPPWMANADSDIGIQFSGSVRILEEFGTLKFHKGNITDIEKRMNILFLSDGFENDKSAFEKTIDQYSGELLKKETYTPWNLLADRLNIWSYYTSDLSKYSSVESEHIMVSGHNSSKPTIMELYSFISFFDTKVLPNATTLTNFEGRPFSEFVDFIKKLNPAVVSFLELGPLFDTNTFPYLKRGTFLPTEGEFVNLSELCSCVGLPSEYDSDNLSNTFSKWNNLGWVDGITNQAIPQVKRYLHPYVFKIWQKLKGRIFLEKTDTSYGATNTFLQRKKREVFEPLRHLGIGTAKFPPTIYKSADIKYFGSYISKISSSLINNFGQIFYNENGNPKFGSDKNKNMKYLVKPSDNIVILSRVRTNGTYGTNQIMPLAHTEQGQPQTPFILHRSVVSVEAKIATSFECKSTTVGGIKKYEQDNLDVKEVKNQVKNTIIHEFSHNYLRDEYSAKFGDLNQDATERNDLQELVEYSNLHMGKDLETQTYFIDASKIKWRWPRVKKIGIGIVDQSENNIKFEDNIYSCTIQTNALDDKINVFAKNDRILLRKRFLFEETTYVQCTIDSVEDIPNDNYHQKIKFTTTASFQTADYDDGFIIILPFWRTDNEATENDFQRLVHHKVEEAILQANYLQSSISSKPGRPMEYVDGRNNNRPQNIIKQFLDTSPPSFKNFIAQAEINKSKIVGLYAGGMLSYIIGIYHATGFCSMRGFVGEDREDVTQQELLDIEKAKLITSNSFCPVCSYILIDYIDPLKHPTMNVKYGSYI